ncbi:hypothetical protein EMIHUDRAFT_258595 [Emiliania huxleyi CCMP1516]|uniref:RING-type domain-containing protein n=2 Tax=Emiliania huxleyi TaxID=2903 RepID=A0A0D3I8J7_EMIH1|nr:hypothetical protein EMIHUDRAFT_258595 [Emiliania huxleyi CCMP1516]EOD07582.1 hypothetical protein EMIHUDRAFT_258595 [Emiliania huxleyi CCMP1516]|eukprot:XP_005760011.1 hypothetical protein EMIHUDRAFT_258595 [Emiliania huxleyi CCMP1516]
MRGEKECPICLETLEPSTGGLVKTACPGGHIFHRSCLYRCFGDGCTADCPMCRQPIAKGDETPLPRPDKTPPKRRRISGFNNREAVGALPRQSLRVCMRMGLPTEHAVR